MPSSSYGSLSSTETVIFPCSNQDSFSEFSAHFDIPVHTKTKRSQTQCAYYILSKFLL